MKLSILQKDFQSRKMFTNNDEPIRAEFPTNTKSVRSVADMKYNIRVENGNIMRNSSDHCGIF